MMPAYGQSSVPVQEVLQLRQQGLTDNLIMNELARRGYDPQQVQVAITQADAGDMQAPGYGYPGAGSSYPSTAASYPAGPPSHPSAAPSAPGALSEEGNIYERIEEIAEGLINEKWDELLGEVKKIVEWKEKMEQQQMKLRNDVDKLKEDFTVLHQGVLGKIEEYDGRMRDVGTELKAVGKVFKDVVPEFIANVKELSAVTRDLKKGKS